MITIFVVLLVTLPIALIFWIQYNSINKKLALLRIDLIAYNATVLEKLNLNFISRKIFTASQNEHNLVIKDGLNRIIRNLFRLSNDNIHSYENIFAFTYNGYPALLIQKRVPNFDYSQSKVMTMPIFNSETEVAFLVPKPNELEFHTQPSLKNSYKDVMKFYAQNKKMSPMDSAEFDQFFPAIRNNETQFRVLFSPLAQENLVNKIKTIGSFSLRMSNAIFYIGSAISRPQFSSFTTFSVFNQTLFSKTSSNNDSLRFKVFHDLNQVCITKDELVNKLTNNYISSKNIIDRFTTIFSAIPLYKSPFFINKNIDTGDDDLSLEEVEICLNNSDNFKSFFRYDIPGLLTFNKRYQNENVVELLSTSYNQITKSYRVGQIYHTETHYRKYSETLYAYIFSNTNHQVSKY
jgi:hypothetical protein